MTDAQFLDLTREGLWAATLASIPVLATALLVGILVGLLQALTSIQELTLTFVPKLAAMMVAFWLSMSFMGNVFVTYFQDQILPIVAGLR